MTITEVHFASFEERSTPKSVLFIKKKSIGEMMYAEQSKFWRYPIINLFTKCWINLASKWIEKDIRKLYSSNLRREVLNFEVGLAGKDPPLLGSKHV